MVSEMERCFRPGFFWLSKVMRSVRSVNDAGFLRVLRVVLESAGIEQASCIFSFSL